ncbi:DUF4157 domain-containing protein [Actinokineospora auranticolor]|uniref:Uncharacterized protein DUF4157 n=1 Tax=Actinokineospora auranticolor TaxID=155976 RepID=A0A2S6GTF4_9PSEU|nr:DUF4157 domain-containing protein [Actinokineospora auranticolor]PPK68469.1 uncharacterized protein DUF4157 [Actinokineospora auranticolor]
MREYAKKSDETTKAPTRATSAQRTPTDELLRLQRVVGNRAVADGGLVHSVLSGGGTPLDAPVRAEMESRMGHDFSDVRLHTDTVAQRSAEELGAAAYTSGSHVVVGSGGMDMHTLAHELTHVVQQRSGPVSGTDNGDGVSVSDPSDSFERAAEANAHRVMSEPMPDEHAD